MPLRSASGLTVALALATGACSTGDDANAAERPREDASRAEPGAAPPTARDDDAGPTSSLDDTRRLPAGGPGAPTWPSCPPDAPFVCPADNARGYACSETACAPSCERIGCPTGFVCLDCGAGPECAPAHHTCG